LANAEFELFIRANIKKILKLRDQRDYKERVKKMFKAMYLDTQRKYEKNVRTNMKFITVSLFRKRCITRVAPLRCACFRLTRRFS
jgi:hypothetical protein